jgi:hypothetical protein
MTWRDFLAGRSVAVVGPAPMTADQSSDIDGHDIVYRPVRCPTGGPYGTRIDVAYLNGHWGIEIYDDDKNAMREAIDPAIWWVFKGKGHRRDGLYRRASRPRFALNVNAVTSILFDLVQYDVGSITVYGADLYASGPDRSYDPDYSSIYPRQVQARAVLAHDPWKQMRIHRAVYNTGRVSGDDRYVAAVTMTDQEYQAVIDSWTAVLEEAA